MTLFKNQHLAKQVPRLMLNWHFILDETEKINIDKKSRLCLMYLVANIFFSGIDGESDALLIRVWNPFFRM